MSYIRNLRKVIGSRPIIGVGATVIVRNQHGEVLFQKRSDTGTWGLPGGHMEFGESLEDTALRELHEETGLIAGELVLLDVLSGPDFFFEYPNGNQMHSVIVLYEAREVSGQLQPHDDETISLKFFSLDIPPPLESRALNVLKHCADKLKHI